MIIKKILNENWVMAGINPKGKREIEINVNLPLVVHEGLINEGIIPDPFYRDQAKKCQWIEDWTWEFSCLFSIEEHQRLEHQYICFEGIDTFSQIYLNKKCIQKTDNMFVPYVIDISKYLSAGKNELKLIFDPYKEKIKDMPDHYKAAFNEIDRVHVRRMQCTFYWDWVNRFITYGIWKDVCYISYNEGKIEDIHVTTSMFDKYSACEQIVIENSIDEEYLWMEAQITDPTDSIVWCERQKVTKGCTYLQADIKDYKLWWPNGFGEQNLYTLKVKLINNRNECVDIKNKRFGIRTVRVEQLHDEEGGVYDSMNKHICELRNESEYQKGRGFILIVNGERIFAKGGNWVPADPFPSRISQEKYKKLLMLIKESNSNILRIWGGGILEPEVFFDTCDELGIMVTQDFLMACATYPEDQKIFLENIEKEVLHMVKRLRTHPSLIWWAGDNENSMGLDFDAPNRTGKIVEHEVIRPILKKLDPYRLFFPTSPYGGRPNMSLSIGDSHYAQWEDINIHQNNMDGYLKNVEAVGRYMSESTSMGAPCITTLEKFLDKEDYMGDDSKMLEYHTKDNPHKKSGYPSLFKLQELMAKYLLGEFKNFEDRLHKLEYVQYEWIRVTMESARRHKWYCGGLQYWMTNDCWPALGWSMIDYYKVPKAGWYSMKRACNEVISSITCTNGKLDIWICNDTLKRVEGKIIIRVIGEDGKYKNDFFTYSYLVMPNESNIVSSFSLNALDLKRREVVIVKAIGNHKSDLAYYYHKMPYEIPVNKAKIEKKVDGNTITLWSEKYIREVVLVGDAIFDDNYFTLLPNEKKRVKCNSFDNRKLDMEKIIVKVGI